MITYCTCSGVTPDRSSAARIAISPSLVAGRSFNAPSSRPIGVRAPWTMTELIGYPPVNLTAAQVKTSDMSFDRLPGVRRIDHVGIAVPDLDAAIEFYGRVFGMTCVHTEVNEDQGVREAMLAV